ncbi:MAG TPA: hypothetical protein VGN57_18895 [Pirellulaceae bacterium]|jgi:hypothetical protein|nr:hypothetical protein [Pirellulaceae bacterium]
MNLKLLLAYVGLAGGLVLVAFDFFTSVEGYQSFQQNAKPHWIMAVAPWALSAICLAFNGLAMYILMMIQSEDESKARLIGLWVSFIITFVWDWGSSVVGFLTLMTGTDNIGSALSQGNASSIIVGLVTAILVAMGPFITTLFGDYIRTQGGFFNLFSSILSISGAQGRT